jgi:oxygen-dependent protoporphyrinogen oxidase
MEKKKKRIIVLGAGISGLAAAYKHAQDENCIVTVLEKSKQAGGHLSTERSSDFLFERGPRTFRKTSHALLALAKQLNLTSSLIDSSPSAAERYLWMEQRFVKAPSLSLLKTLFLPLLKEWCVPPATEDETIYQFAARRFGHTVAETLFDPLTLGVFAGDIHTLSMSACFPKLKIMEREHGSLTRSFFAQKRSKEKGLFSFREGASTLINALAAHLKDAIHFDQEITALKFTSEGIEVVTSTQTWKGDICVSALPAPSIARLLLPHDPEMASGLLSIPYKGIRVVHLGFHKPVLPLKGFGYLVPTKEKEAVMGAVFDSNIFPEQNHSPEETRITYEKVLVKKQHLKRCAAILAFTNIQITFKVPTSLERSRSTHSAISIASRFLSKKQLNVFLSCALSAITCAALLSTTASSKLFV